MILTVAPGLTEFACPTCRMPQMLPPELMARVHQTAPSTLPLTPPSQNLAAHGIDPTKIQLPCASCKAILNVPHGLSRFSCPQCNVDLAVDLSKIKQFLPPPPLEEVNEVCFGYSNFALSFSLSKFWNYEVARVTALLCIHLNNAIRISVCN